MKCYVRSIALKQQSHKCDIDRNQINGAMFRSTCLLGDFVKKKKLNDRNATLAQTSEPICQVFGYTERLHLKAFPPMVPQSFKIYNRFSCESYLIGANAMVIFIHSS